MKSAFEEALEELRRRMGRNVSVPASATWRVDPGASPVVVATMPAADLSRNLQEDAAAVPSFALCLAWWFEHHGILGAGDVRAHVEITGDVGTEDSGLRSQHLRRSLFLLHEFETVLPGRFSHAPRTPVPWPAQPCVNVGATDREAGASPVGAGGEYALEREFTTQPQVVEQFAAIDRIDRLCRRLPVGVFDAAISEKTRWSPGGSSQIDLWAVTADGLTVHLFELKTWENSHLGILPEAFWYARLLHRIRTGDFGGAVLRGGGADMDTVRRAKRIQMWLLVARDMRSPGALGSPRSVSCVHPLVEHGGRSPLEWLRKGLEGSGLDLGILPYENGHRLCLRPDLRWPRPPCAKP